MKLTLVLFAVVLLALKAVSGCKKDEEDPKGCFACLYERRPSSCGDRGVFIPCKKPSQKFCLLDVTPFGRYNASCAKQNDIDQAKKDRTFVDSVPVLTEVENGRVGQPGGPGFIVSTPMPRPPVEGKGCYECRFDRNVGRCAERSAFLACKSNEDFCLLTVNIFNRHDNRCATKGDVKKAKKDGVFFDSVEALTEADNGKAGFPNGPGYNVDAPPAPGPVEGLGCYECRFERSVGDCGDKSAFIKCKSNQDRCLLTGTIFSRFDNRCATASDVKIAEKKMEKNEEFTFVDSAGVLEQDANGKPGSQGGPGAARK